MTLAELPEVLTTKQVADLVQVCERTVRAWSRGGTHDFPRGVRAGPRVLRYQKRDIVAWLDKRSRAGA